MKHYGSIEDKKICMLHTMEKCITVTQKSKDFLIEIAHKILCDLHKTVFTQ